MLGGTSHVLSLELRVVSLLSNSGDLERLILLKGIQGLCRGKTTWILGRENWQRPAVLLWPHLGLVTALGTCCCYPHFTGGKTETQELRWLGHDHIDDKCRTRIQTQDAVGALGPTLKVVCGQIYTPTSLFSSFAWACSPCTHRSELFLTMGQARHAGGQVDISRRDPQPRGIGAVEQTVTSLPPPRARCHNLSGFPGRLNPTYLPPKPAHKGPVYWLPSSPSLASSLHFMFFIRAFPPKLPIPESLPQACFWENPRQRHCCFPGGSVVKNPPASAGDTGSIREWGRSPGEGNDNPI